MTQKELLYFEDAIGHIGNISKLLNDFTGKVNNQEIKDFLMMRIINQKTNYQK